MSTKATDIISKEQIAALREAGFVVVHREPTESMQKAGYSVAKYWENGDLYRAYHRMVGESIRLQNLEDG